MYYDKIYIYVNPKELFQANQDYLLTFLEGTT